MSPLVRVMVPFWIHDVVGHPLDKKRTLEEARSSRTLKVYPTETKNESLIDLLKGDLRFWAF